MNAPASQATRKSGLRNLLLGNLFMLVATFFFGVDVPVVKMLIPTWMNAMDVTAFRMLGACALMWLTSLFVRSQKIDRRDWKLLVLGGCIGIFSFIFLFNLSLHYANPIDVAIIMTLPPAFVVGINVLTRGARPSAMEYVGLALSFAGAFVVIAVQHGADKGSDQLLGDVLALLSSLCYALYLVWTERPAKTYSPVTMLKWIYLFASIPTLLLLPDLWKARIWHTAAWQPWFMIAFVVVCVSYVSYFLIAPAEKMISTELTSIYQYLVPVFAALGSLVFGIAGITWLQGAAMAIIVAGMVLSNIGKFRHSHKN